MKEKLSISLDSNVLRDITNAAKAMGIGRSTYIEELLLNETKQTPVVILTSFSEIDEKEKSLMRYKNDQLLDHQLNYLRHQGFKNVFVVTNSKNIKAKIEQEHMDVKIIYDTVRKGSGYNIKLIAKKLQRTFILLYCDIILELDLNNLIRFHKRNRASLTLVLQSQKNVKDLGVAILEGSKIISFEEKPEKTNSHLAYIGCMVVDPLIVFEIKDTKFEVQLNTIENKYGYIYEGFWKDFNKKDDFY